METRASRRSGAVAAAAEAEWTAMLAELAEWKEENGGSMASLTDEDGGSKKRGSKKPKISKLGRWVAEMRKEKKEGRLSKDKEDKLNEIGFEWGKAEEGETTGASKIATAEGPESSTDNVADGEGEAKNQKKRRRNPSRNAKKLHNDFIEEAFFQGELTQEDGETAKSQGGDADGAKRKAKKRKVGDQQWEQKFEELVRFKAQYGHFRIPVKEMPLLKYWAQNQKITYRKGKLSEERRVRLESVGFHWGKQRKGDTPQKGSDRQAAAKTPSAAHGRLTSASVGKPQAGGEGEGEAEGDGSSGDEDEEYEDEDDEQEVATTDTSAASSKKKAAKEGNATTPSNGASNAAARGAAHPSPMYGQPKPSIHTTVATHSTPSYSHPPTTSQFGSGKDHRMVLSPLCYVCVCVCVLLLSAQPGVCG
jgi:hypothetical protein